MPNAAAMIHNPNMYQPPSVVDDEGPLSSSKSAQIISDLEARTGDSKILGRHLAFEQAISGSPLVLGNQVTLLQNGDDTYRAMFAAIEGATRNINLETYIFESSSVGKEFADALIAKQRQGVQVNVIYDGFGSFFTRRSFFARMRAAGIRMVEFDPIDPFASGFRWSPLHRDHRKLLIVDGTIAITGGINISKVYEGTDPAASKWRAQGRRSWRDTDVEIEGPVVAEFQESFVANWMQQGGAPLDYSHYFPPLANRGDVIVRALGSEPRQFSTIYVTLISAIRCAEKNIYITDAYFAPGSQMLQALEHAARRGVDVRLLLPGKNNEPLIGAAARSDFGDLLEAGVKIYLWQGKMLHAKTATIDGVWSTVGSSNLDWWSIARNDEINSVILSVKFGNEMNAAFMNDLKDSREIDSTVWQKRPPLEQLDETLTGFLQPMM